LEAGQLLRDRVGSAIQVDYKGEIDLVTEVDKAAEALIASGIRQAHPAHALVGEEGSTTGVDPEAAEWTWIVDPIDGTTNFAHGYPHFCVSIAVIRNRIGEIGVIYDPNRDELFCGVRGEQATLNGKPISVSKTPTLKQSILSTGFSYQVEQRDEQNAIWLHLHRSCQGIRREGSAALGVAWLAAGRTDGFYERPINAWDVGAGAIIAMSAGATVTRLLGGPYGAFDQELTVSNGLIHEELVREIANAVAGVELSR
jgi:myo-inositol-1(or 4)-monophosphatase